MKTVKGQPGDYARTTLREMARYVSPWPELGPMYACLREKYSLPTTMYDSRAVGVACQPAQAHEDFSADPVDPAAAPPGNRLRSALHGYSGFLRTSEPLTAIFLVAAGTALLRRRRAAGDIALLSAVAILIMVPPVLVAMYEARYALPALPLIAIATALAVHVLRTPAGLPGGMEPESPPPHPLAPLGDLDDRSSERSAVVGGGTVDRAATGR